MSAIAEQWLIEEPDGTVRPHARPPRIRRLLRDASNGAADVHPRFAVEAVVLFEKLRRLGGRVEVSKLRREQGRTLGLQAHGVLDDAIRDLVTLGVVRRVTVSGRTRFGARREAEAIEVVPGFEALGLVSRWSRVGTGRG